MTAGLSWRLRVYALLLVIVAVLAVLAPAPESQPVPRPQLPPVGSHAGHWKL